MTLAKRTLQRLSICPCGFTTLRDGIEVGKEYEVDAESVSLGVYGCGGCRKVYLVNIISASQDASIYFAPLPIGLFDENFAAPKSIGRVGYLA